MEKGDNTKTRIVYVLFLLFLFISLPITLSAELNLTYDNNGNLITGDGKYRTYNEFNQLISIQQNDSNGTVLEEYIYHPVEDRILAKIVHDYHEGSFETETVIIYANDNLIRTSTRRIGSNWVNTSDKIYIKDKNGFVAEFNPNQSKIFYYNDHLGSTSLLTNESGGIIEETFYEPFGGIVSGGNVSHFYYEGKDWDSIINEYDFNFRKYNPDLLIFTKPEQEFPDFYDPQQLNRYSFERNNPYKYVDPDGKNPILIAAGIGGIIGAGFYGLEVLRGDLDFSLEGLAAYTAGGAVGGAVGVAATLVLGTSTLALVGAGGLSGFSSQVTTNFGTGKPLLERAFSSTSIGLVTGGLSKYLPDPAIYKIKNPASYFTTKTGQQFISNIFLTETTSNAISTGNTASQLLYNSISKQSSQINSAQQINTGGSNGNGMCVVASSNNQRTSGSSRTINTISNTLNKIKSFFRSVFRRR